MPPHIDLGKKGEALAVEWLASKGYTITETNWRSSRYEIDIIAARDGILHFIEVKTRSSLTYGHPEESVSTRKIRHLLKGASEWLYRHPDNKRVQYDVLAITLLKNAEPEYVLFEDVYL